MLPALVSGDKIAVATHLKAFKEAGLVRHDRTLRIPSSERIPALIKAEGGYNAIYTILVAALANSLANLNLRKGPNEDQILELVETIIDESHDDNLSLEDVLLFLQQMERGKRGKIYDRLDMPTFFELFEDYRQERYLALRYIQYEAHAHYKALGDPTRTTATLVEQTPEFKEYLKSYNEKNIQPDAPTGG